MEAAIDGVDAELLLEDALESERVASSFDADLDEPPDDAECRDAVVCKALPTVFKIYAKESSTVLHVGKSSCAVVWKMLRLRKRAVGVEAFPYEKRPSDKCLSLMQKGLLRRSTVTGMPFNPSSFGLVLVTNLLEYKPLVLLDVTLQALAKMAVQHILVYIKEVKPSEEEDPLLDNSFLELINPQLLHQAEAFKGESNNLDLSAPVNLQTREWWVNKFRENGLLDVTSPKRKRFLVHGQQFDSKAYIAAKEGAFFSLVKLGTTASVAASARERRRHDNQLALQGPSDSFARPNLVEVPSETLHAIQHGIKHAKGAQGASLMQSSRFSDEKLMTLDSLDHQMQEKLTPTPSLVREAHAHRAGKRIQEIAKDVGMVTKGMTRGNQASRTSPKLKGADIARLRARADELQVIIESRKKEIEIRQETLRIPSSSGKRKEARGSQGLSLTPERKEQISNDIKHLQADLDAHISAKRALDAEINELQAQQANKSSELFQSWEAEKKAYAQEQKRAQKKQEESARLAQASPNTWLRNRKPVEPMHKPRTTRAVTSKMRSTSG
eukprot:scaffold1603_cov415-Prasinococcus_capsulatus_cf.AAC.12